MLAFFGVAHTDTTPSSRTHRPLQVRPHSFGVIQTTSLAIFESMQHEKNICHLCISVYRCIVIFMSAAYYFDIRGYLKNRYYRKSSRWTNPCPHENGMVWYIGTNTPFSFDLKWGTQNVGQLVITFFHGWSSCYPFCHLEAWGYTLQ